MREANQADRDGCIMRQDEFQGAKVLGKDDGHSFRCSHMWLCIPDAERKKECSYTEIGHGRQRDANGLLHGSCCHGR